jgi:hypothetical protein
VEFVVLGEVEEVSPQRSSRVDAKGRPVRLLISPERDHDVTYADALLV